MSDDRRALLRRALLKEQLQKEQQSVQERVKQMTPDEARKLSATEIESLDQQIQQEQDNRTIEAGLTGALQGATLGFSDELGAGLDVSKEVLSGKGPNSIVDRWRELQKKREDINRQLAEESPIAYTAGELAGGIGTAALTPSLGGMRIAAAGRKLSPAIGRFLAGKTGSSALNIAGKGTTSLIEGAPVGAAYGLGSSEADISRPAELAADVGSGAAMGSMTGFALGAGGKAVSEATEALGKRLSDSDTARHLADAYKLGKEGIDLGSSKAEDLLRTQGIEAAKGATSNILTVDKQLGQLVGKSLEDAQKRGALIDVGSSLSDANNKIFKTLFIDSPTLGEIIDPKSAKLIKMIGQREITELNPVEARALKDELNNLADKLAGYNSDSANFAKKTGRDLAKAIDIQLKEQIPEYADAARKFEANRRLVSEHIMSQGTPEEFRTVRFGDLKDPEAKLFSATERMLQEGKLSGMASGRERATLAELKGNLNKLKELDPDLEQRLGKSIDEFHADLVKKADRQAMVRKAYGSEPSFDPDIASSPGKAVSKITAGSKLMGYGLVNKAGLASQSAPVRMGKKLFSATDDQLRGLAGKLKTGKGTELVGNALEKALDNKSDVGRNAVLFKLLQDPNYRNMLRDEGLVDEENTNE